jgi:hypothetical protein
MKTLKKVPITPVFVELMPDVLEEGKVYISKKYSVAIHLCLCGCGEKTVMPFGDDDPGWWKLVEEGDGKISFVGSVGNYQMPCKSHYVIQRNVANFI